MTNKHQPHFCFFCFIYYPLNKEQRVHYFIHSAVCTRPAANRSRPAGHEKPVFRPWLAHLSLLTVFTVRRYALHGICYRNSVCPSVCLSVCLSVTLVDCVHMVRPTLMISSPYGSPIILVSGDITFIPKFEGGPPERGR